MADKAALLKELNEVSFAVNDITLYLDTHPEDHDALQLFQTCKDRRKTALEQFEQHYYPLTVDCIRNLDSELAHWTWNDGPAPWEGGME